MPSRTKKKVTQAKVFVPENVRSEARIFAFCEFIVQDNKNRFSLINVFDRINAKKVPLTYPMKLYISAMATEGEHTFKLYAENPNNSPTEIAKITNVIGEDNLFNFVLDAIFSFDYFGKHYFSYYIDDELVKRSFLYVNEIIE